jgi:hypothetical protein
MRSPSASSTLAWVLGQPVDLQVGHQRAQLFGDRDVTLRVAEPDRGRDVQRPRPPVGTVGGAVAGRTVVVARACALDQASQREVDRHWLARPREMAAVGDCHQLATSCVRENLGVCVAGDLVVGAGDDEHWAADPSRQRQLVAAGGRRGPVGDRAGNQRLGIGFVRPGDRVLDLLRRMGRVEHPNANEPVHEVVVVGAPVGAVELQPPARHRRRPQEDAGQPRVGHDPPAQPAKPAGGEPRADERRREHSLGVLGAQQQRPLRSTRDRCDHRPLGAGGVQYR